MPITVHPKTSIENDDIHAQLNKLYDTSPEFNGGADALEQIEARLSKNESIIYVAEFNSKIIAAIWCTELNSQSKRLEYIVIHPANRGRGVADRLISEVCRLEEEKGVKNFEGGCPAIRRCLTKLEKI